MYISIIYWLFFCSRNAVHRTSQIKFFLLCIRNQLCLSIGKKKSRQWFWYHISNLKNYDTWRRLSFGCFISRSQKMEKETKKRYARKWEKLRSKNKCEKEMVTQTWAREKIQSPCVGLACYEKLVKRITELHVTIVSRTVTYSSSSRAPAGSIANFHNSLLPCIKFIFTTDSSFSIQR